MKFSSPVAGDRRALLTFEFGLTFFDKRIDAFDEIRCAGAGREAFSFRLQLIVEGGVKRGI